MSNSSASDDRIRDEAYRLWEEAGRPHGRDAEFWHQAATMVADAVPTMGAPEATAPAKAAASTPKPGKKAAKAAAAVAVAAPPPPRKPRKSGSQPTNHSA